MPFQKACIAKHSRRHFLGSTAASLGSAAALPAMAQERKETIAGPYDFSDPYDCLAAYTKTRGRLDGSVGIFHYVAHVYGVPDGQVTQLMYRREGVSQHRMTIRKDRTIDCQIIECNYVQNAVTGAIVDDFFDNPLTGNLVPVHHQPPIPGPLVRINPTGGFRPNVTWEPPAAFVNIVEPPLFGEGRVFFNDDLLMYNPQPEGSLPTENPRSDELQWTQLTTFSASTVDVQNPELMSAKSFAFVTADIPWAKWLGMDKLRGNILTRYLAEKINDIEEIPKWLRQRIDTDHPNFFSDPGI